MRTVSYSLLLLCLGSLLSACASQDSQPEPTLEQRLEKNGYRQAEEVDSVRGFQLSGWNWLDDHHIMVDNGPGQNYLVSFNFPCRDLNAVNQIGYTSTVGTLSKLDRIMARSSSGIPINCPIGSLYKLERLPRQ